MFPLYFDENYQRANVITRLRQSGVDCLTSNESGNAELTDAQQLEFATMRGRAIVTLDRGDFHALHAEWMHRGHDHAGIIILTNTWIPNAIAYERLMRLQAERDAAQMLNAILFLGSTPLEEYP